MKIMKPWATAYRRWGARREALGRRAGEINIPASSIDGIKVKTRDFR
jgi:hypothetical protein